MRAVVSVSDGGLWPTPADASLERRHVIDLAQCLARLAGHHELVVTYAGDPYVRLVVDQQWTLTPHPRLDVLAAEGQAAAGYQLAQQLHNEMGGQVAAILTQVRVDPNDEAFRRPGTPVGPACDERSAHELAGAGWMMTRDGGGWRRSVPVPEPLAVVEAPTIELLLRAGVVVVCAAGGIPVVADFSGSLRAVPALVPQEAASAVLAAQIGAERLVFLTADPDYPEVAARHLREVAVDDVRRGEGTAHVEPRVLDAACAFVERTGGSASIGPLWDGRSVMEGDAGLVVTAAPVMVAGDDA